LKTLRLLPVVLGTAIQMCWTLSPLFAQSKTPIAFLSDIHLQDVYAKLDSGEFQGVINPKNGKLATIRTMESQLNSTRLFNENYFALYAALDELVQKGIKLVVLPGDFTDDGQPMNVLALKRILQEYASSHDMRFFLTTGNHDPVSPFGSRDGKTDFLGKLGENQAIAGSPDVFPNLDAALTEQINNWGYYEICEQLADFGFSPSEKDIFWTHPFENFDYERYSWKKAKSGSSIENRSFTIPGTHLQLPDASYLVEPVDGIWLLAIDGNVYSPGGNQENPTNEDWSGSSIGFNLASQIKVHQLKWIKLISEEAKSRGKTLISFSHYPLVEFHDGASESMKQLFGSGKFQLNRVPESTVSEKYSAAGIQIHFAGHMHFNDTGIHSSETGNLLFNIQIPSLAAFPPAYKVMEEKSPGQIHIQTETLENVNRMDEFFDLYQMENTWLTANKPESIWNLEILKSPNYLDYTRFHLRELIRLRFVRSDWPGELGTLVNQLTEIELENWIQLERDAGDAYLKSILSKSQSVPKENLTPGTVMEDFYLLKNGGDLGKSLIPKGRQELYSRLLEKMQESEESPETLQSQMKKFLHIFSKLLNGLPSDDFVIDLRSQEIRVIEN
jgi:3',5'-cyclic AMP phosphodiesterase CpdA